MGERQADKIEALQARVAELEGRCRAVTERASAAVELLREIQWIGKSHDEPVCPCCDENAPHALVPGSGQHAADCRLAALIGPVVVPALLTKIAATVAVVEHDDEPTAFADVPDADEAPTP